ncbi:MAG TPA: hypothetical protein VG433_02410 [Pirellulales bacterium]|jgi:hypothetical protein|nr:hypothetical protein [Pirellulales bacterium]
MPDTAARALQPEDALAVRRLIAAKMLNIAAHYYAGALGCSLAEAHSWVAEAAAGMRNGQPMPGQVH